MKHDIEAAEMVTKKAVMEINILGEGDLFGVRAIEKGFYGGVAQSTPSLAASSPPRSPVSTIIDSNGLPVSISLSQGSSISELSLSGSSLLRTLSDSTSLKGIAPNSTLRLQPSDAELNGWRNHDPTVALSTCKPQSPPKPEAAAKSQSYLPSNIQPSFNHKVQSYVQWRLSADIKRTRCS